MKWDIGTFILTNINKVFPKFKITCSRYPNPESLIIPTNPMTVDYFDMQIDKGNDYYRESYRNYASFEDKVVLDIGCGLGGTTFAYGKTGAKLAIGLEIETAYLLAAEAQYSPMKILFISSDFPPADGGIAIFNYHICKELCRRGHKVTVLAPRQSGSETFDRKQDFCIKRLRSRFRPSSLEIVCQHLHWISKEKIEVIFFGHFGSVHWLSSFFAKEFFKIPYVILVHGTDLNAYFRRFSLSDRWASQVVLNNADAVVVNSRVTHKLVEDYGYPSARIHIINPGADTDRFISFRPQADIIEKLGIKSKKVLLTVARLVGKKNHENVLRALPLALKQVPELIYLVAGKGEEEQKLKKMVKDLGLEKYVSFLGHIEPEDLPVYYNACDVFVMPSKTVDIDYESFGIVYLEANACAKPVIASRTGGIEDAVVDGITGIMVDPDNITEISEAIIRLLTDQDYAKKLGDNGRRRAEEGFGWPMVGQKVESVLRQTVQNNGR